MTTVAMPPTTGGPSQQIAAEIRAELGRRQLSNRQLALMIDGVSYAWVNRRISACDVEMTFEDVQKIAGALGVPVVKFLAPLLGNVTSPTGPITGAYLGQTDTDRDEFDQTFRVRSRYPRPDVMRTNRSAA